MSRLPSLGPRGEGWVIGQAIGLVAVAALGLPGLGDLPPSTAIRWGLLLGGLALLALSAGIGLAGVRALGRNLTAVPRPREDATLVDHGIYRHIRHPLYASLIVGAVGWSLAMASAGSAVATVVLAAWLDAKSRREERWLGETFSGYEAYLRRTHRFVPGLY